MRDHPESTRLQYALVDRAVGLGWPADRVVVIDEDLGRSGAGTVQRPGFQRLVAEISLGHVGLVVGILTFVLPGITALFLLYMIAVWAIMTGFFEILIAIRLRHEVRGEWLMALGGIASVLFGFLLVLFPSAGAVAVIWWIGVYALIFGVLLLALAFRLRSWDRAIMRGVPRPA